LKYQTEAAADEACGHSRNRPVVFWIRDPSKPEQTDGEEDGCRLSLSGGEVLGLASLSLLWIFCGSEVRWQDLWRQTQ
jgi:hypothetical protein